MMSISEYFDNEATIHDELFLQKMGLGEFYDRIEEELTYCEHKDKILVLGCGSGLEIERIKFPAEVIGVDISKKMLDVLHQKKLYNGLNLTTICGSLLDLDFDIDKYDIVLTCYVMHHFNINQKLEIYRKIHQCLKKKGVFINGDTMACSLEEEEYYRRCAEEIYKREKAPFASLHIDSPFCLAHEIEVLKETGFSEINIVKEWTKTKLYKCRK